MDFCNLKNELKTLSKILRRLIKFLLENNTIVCVILQYFQYMRMRVIQTKLNDKLFVKSVNVLIFISQVNSKFAQWRYEKKDGHCKFEQQAGSLIVWFCVTSSNFMVLAKINNLQT